MLPIGGIKGTGKVGRKSSCSISCRSSSKHKEFEAGYLLQTLGHATVNFTVGKDLWVPFRAFVHLIIQQQQQQFQGISEVHGLWPKGIKILNLVL